MENTLLNELAYLREQNENLKAELRELIDLISHMMEAKQKLKQIRNRKRKEIQDLEVLIVNKSNNIKC